MKIKFIVTTGLFLLFGLNTVYSQFFIPIIIPYSVKTYACPTKNEKALEYYEKGTSNFKENVYLAIASFRESIKLDSFFCDAYHGLTLSYMKIQDYDQAMESTDYVLDNINALQPWFLRQKGIIYMRMKDYPQASDYFQKMTSMQPREPLWYYFLAESQIKLNLLDSAKKTVLDMEYIMRQKGDWEVVVPSTYLQGKIAYYENDFDVAYRALNSIRKNNRRNADFCYHFGLVLKELGEIKQARRYIKRSIRYGYADVDETIVKELNI